MTLPSDSTAAQGWHAAPQNAGQSATAAFLGVVFLVLPLVVHNGFFDITETKFLCFLILGTLYLIVMTALCVLGMAQKPFARIKGLAAADLGLSLFALCFCIGALLSGRFLSSLFAPLSRYQGVAAILLYTLLFGFVTRNFAWTRLNDAALLFSFAAAALIAVLNDFGLDPLGMYRALSEGQHWQYVSTLGNTNFYSSFLGALLPVALFAWCCADRLFLSAASGIALFCGTAGMLPTASESFMLAFLTMLWLAPLLLFSRPIALKRYFAALCGMCALLFILRALSSFLPTRQYLSLSLRVLTHPAALLTLFLFSLFCCLWLQRKKAFPHGWRKAYLITSLALALSAALLLVLCNTAFSGHDFGRFERFIRINGDWGTDRGRIYAHCLAVYAGFTPLQKLFGGGADCLYLYDAANRLFPDAILDSAHNEYLQYLLTSGALGLLGYLSALVGTAAFCLKRAARAPLAAAFIVGALAYAVSAFVNIAQPVSTPFFFLFLAAAAGSAARGQYGDQDNQEREKHAADDQQ